MKDQYHVYRTNIWGGKSIAFTSEALRPGEKLIHGGLLSLSTQNTIGMYLPRFMADGRIVHWNDPPSGVDTHTFDFFDPRQLAAYDFFWRYKNSYSKPEGFVVIDHRNEGIRQWK